MGFPFDGARDDVRESGGITAKNGVEAFLKKSKKFCVRDDSIFDHFGKPAAVLALRQRLQHGGIHEDEARGIKSAYEVLPFRKIDAGFPADGAVHLCDQRSWDLHQRDTAEARGRSETGYVADYAAANGDNQGVAVDFRAHQRSGKLFDGP